MPIENMLTVVKSAYGDPEYDAGFPIVSTVDEFRKKKILFEF